MSISTEQYNALLARQTRTEQVLNDVLVAIGNLVSATQVQQLLTIQRAQIEALDTTVSALEDRVEAIEEEPLT